MAKNAAKVMAEGRTELFWMVPTARAFPGLKIAAILSIDLMLTIALSSFFLITLTVLVHYEVLSALNRFLPTLNIPSRSKLLVALFAAFLAHLLEMVIYGLAIYALITVGGIGDLKGFGTLSLLNCMYFSAETFTSLGFGDIAPVGPIRLLAGLEALNGLLLIGWSASYVTIAMERFWREDEKSSDKNGH